MSEVLRVSGRIAVLTVAWCAGRFLALSAIDFVRYLFAEREAYRQFKLAMKLATRHLK